MFSPAEWEDGWYSYMENSWDSNVRGCAGDPGEQGHWIIEKWIEPDPVATEIKFTNNPNNGEVVVYWVDKQEEKE